MECSRCGRDNPNHVRYCLDCGSVVRENPPEQQKQVSPSAPVANAASSRVACSACGVDNPTGSAFCRECGSRLASAEAAAPIVPRQRIPSEVPGGALSAGSLDAASLEVATRQRRPTPGLGPTGPIFGSEPAALASRLPVRPGASSSAPPVPGDSVAPPPPGISVAPAPVVERKEKLCKACNALNGPAARFCQICGLPLDKTSGERPKSAPPELVAESVPEADLVVIAQDGSPGRRFPLQGTQISIGSAPDAGISLKRDPYVDLDHARIIYRNGGYMIEDRKSTNGVFVRIGGPVPLRDADMLLLGLEVLRFEIVPENERNLSPATRGATRVFGTPPSARYAKLTLITVEEQPRDVYYLSRAETVLGRELGDIVFTEDPFMSRRHAAIRRDTNTNSFTLRDLGSSNGTFVAIRGSHPLSHGDHVRIGQHLFRLDVRRGG